MPGSASRSFRNQLQAELAKWRAEGLVDEPTAAALAARYPPDAGLPAAAAILLLGGALVGAGIIALVAYNWEELPRALRLAALVGGTAALQLSGAWLARAGRPRLGHALVLAGVGAFGASIGLVAQIYQVHDVWYGGVGAFGAGALATALLLESAPTGALACVLAAIWAAGRGGDFPSAAPWIAHLCLAGSLGLAVWLRAAPLGAVAVLASAIALGPALEVRAASLAALLASLVLLAILVTSLRLAVGRGAARLLRPAARAAAALFLGAAYLASLGLGLGELLRPASEGALLPWLLPPALGAALLVAVALYRRGAELAWESPSSGVLLASGALLALGLAGGWPEGARRGLANLALVAFGAAALLRSVRRAERGPFWTGLLLLALVAVTRFLDLDVRLWVKGLGFVAAGAAVIAVGLAFERHLQRGQEASHAP